MPRVLPRYRQAPADVLDYPFDWTGGVPPGLPPGETISSATFAVGALTIVAQQVTTTNATVWLTGGTLGSTYTVICKATTNLGHTYDDSLLLYVSAPEMPLEVQSPDDVRDWPLDWGPVLAPGEAISSATFSVPSGLTLVSQSSGPSIATVRLSGGTLGTTYTVGCQIVTNQGRTYTGGFLLRIVQL